MSLEIGNSKEAAIVSEMQLPDKKIDNVERLGRFARGDNIDDFVGMSVIYFDFRRNKKFVSLVRVDGYLTSASLISFQLRSSDNEMRLVKLERDYKRNSAPSRCNQLSFMFNDKVEIFMRFPKGAKISFAPIPVILLQLRLRDKF